MHTDFRFFFVLWSTQRRLSTNTASSIGYPLLKLEQRRVLKAFVEGRAIFVSLPTGYGKSLGYALLPTVFDLKHRQKERTSIVMIVSPSIALMKDQASMFTEKGISAGYASDKESTDKETRRKVLHESTSWFSSVLKHYS
jgi:superfamily II DNA helicase RecQ